MISTNNPINPPSEELCCFILNKIGIDETALNLGKKKAISENTPLPITLWTYGLINLIQYEQILDWQRNINK